MQHQLNVLVEFPFKYMNQNIKFLLILVPYKSVAYFKISGIFHLLNTNEENIVQLGHFNQVMVTEISKTVP